MKELINVNIRITRPQREYFEQAAEIAGFESLNDFILAAASEKADTLCKSNLPGFLSKTTGKLSSMQLRILLLRTQG